MILLLAVTVWMLVLALVAGVCAAARSGDAAQPSNTPGARQEPTVWESFERAEIAVPANARAGAAVDLGPFLLYGDGVAV